LFSDFFEQPLGFIRLVFEILCGFFLGFIDFLVDDMRFLIKCSGVGGSGAAAGVGACEAASADGNTVGAGAVGSTGGVLLGAVTGCAGAGTG
jgi:hypothetical protein